ncbi:Serine/threonine-protein kinase 17A, partial [Neofusicoccum ribis]
LHILQCGNQRVQYPEYFAKFFGWYADEHAYYLAMEYMEHGSLFDYMKNSAAAFPEEEVKEIVSQLLEGLRYMHQHDYAHRDLKPGDLNGASSLATSTTGIYSQAYCAPEMRGFVRDRCETDNYVYTSLVDIWSLGVIAFEMLAKERPFPKTADVVSYYDGEAGFPAEELLNVPVSPAWVDFLAMLLQPRPSGRPTAVKALENPWLESYQWKEAESEDDASEVPHSESIVPTEMGREGDKQSEVSKTTLEVNEDGQRSHLRVHDGLTKVLPGTHTVHRVEDTRNDLLYDDHHKKSLYHGMKERVLRWSLPVVYGHDIKKREQRKPKAVFDAIEDPDKKRRRREAERRRLDDEEDVRNKIEEEREEEARRKRHEARRTRRAEEEQRNREEEERKERRAARKAEDAKKQEEEEEARRHRHRERKRRERERERERRFSAVEANDLPVSDAFPSPIIEATEPCERGPNVPPAAPRRRHTDGLSKRTRDASLTTSQFGRSNTTPTTPKNKNRVISSRDRKGKER